MGKWGGRQKYKRKRRKLIKIQITKRTKWKNMRKLHKGENKGENGIKGRKCQKIDKKNRKSEYVARKNGLDNGGQPKSQGEMCGINGEMNHQSCNVKEASENYVRREIEGKKRKKSENSEK